MFDKSIKASLRTKRRLSFNLFFCCCFDVPAPSGVQPPSPATVAPRSISYTWQSPLSPNGRIVRYILTVNSTVYISTSNAAILSTTVTGLQPFTMYSAVLRVCTSAGCSDSDVSLQRTSEGVPSGVPAPSLTALSTESIEARWTAPSSPNGIILQYELLVETGGISTIVFVGNATDFRVVIDSLLPHTTYTFRLRAATSAGSSTGPAASVRTLQDVPAGVQAPTVVTTARTATLSWTLPSMPNGVLTRYSIRRDGSQLAVNLSSVTLTYTDTGLYPFTMYNYAVVACTSLGCSVGNESAAQTLEDIPEGVNGPVLRVVDEKTVEASWTAPNTSKWSRSV